MNKTIAEQAICAQTDPELFFPEKGQHDKTRSAIAICTGCPVRRACLAEALAEEGTAGASHRFGVRGGCSPRQRARMAKERAEREEVARAVAGCGTAKAYYQHLMAGEPIDEACQAASDTFEQQLAVGRPPAACGTRPGYRAHRARGEQACTPCRQANADADRRLRNTGTTKQPAA